MIDIKNTEQWIKVLKGKHEDINKDLGEREEIVKRYEKQIRLNNDSIANQSKVVDKLNREYAKLKKDTPDDSKGPLEAQIKNIAKDIKAKENEISGLDRAWITYQTNLVTKKQELDEINEEISREKTKKTILEQRKIRLNGDVSLAEKDIKSLELGLKSLQNDMNKINLLLAKNKEVHDQLENEHYHLEKDFKVRLQELEAETVDLENGIEGLKDEKAMILQEIVESER
jgi:chromosome segregation ATPase